jgi:hypothetical protein
MTRWLLPSCVPAARGDSYYDDEALQVTASKDSLLEGNIVQHAGNCNFFSISDKNMEGALFRKSSVISSSNAKTVPCSLYTQMRMAAAGPYLSTALSDHGESSTQKKCGDVQSSWYRRGGPLLHVYRHSHVCSKQ